VFEEDRHRYYTQLLQFNVPNKFEIFPDLWFMIEPRCETVLELFGIPWPARQVHVPRSCIRQLEDIIPHSQKFTLFGRRHSELLQLS
jgi:hypothetical protein